MKPGPKCLAGVGCGEEPGGEPGTPLPPNLPGTGTTLIAGCGRGVGYEQFGARNRRAVGAGGVRLRGHEAPANAPRSLALCGAVYEFGFFFFF